MQFGLTAVPLFLIGAGAVSAATIPSPASKQLSLAFLSENTTEYDICEDMGASFDASKQLISAMQAELDDGDNQLNEEEKGLIVELIGMLTNATLAAEQSLDALCNLPPDDGKLPPDDVQELLPPCANENYDTNARKNLVAALDAADFVAQTSVSVALSIPFNTPGVSAAVILAVAAHSSLIVAQRSLKDRDDDLSSCILEVAAEAERTVELVQNSVNVVQNSVNGVQNSVNGVQNSVNGVQNSVNGVQNSVNGVQNSVTVLQGTVDDGFDFLACPFTTEQQNNKTSIGQGCDGIDNNCNSIFGTIKRVDECDEDQVPPTISFKNDIPLLGFKSSTEARLWFEDNLETSDDCVSNLTIVIGEVTRRVGEPGADQRLNEITIRVFDPVCEAEASLVAATEASLVAGGAFETIKTFVFIVDDIAPSITCGFERPQDIFHVLDPNFVPNCANVAPFPTGGRDDPLHISYGSSLVDVQFWYQITDDAPSSGQKLPVTITVLSNEFELGKCEQMAVIVKSRDLGKTGAANKVHRGKVYLAPHTCHDVDEGSVAICETEIINNSSLNTRFYDIIVTTRDEIGNERNATCSVIVIPKHHLSGNQCAQSAKASKGPGLSAKAAKAISVSFAKGTANSVSVAEGTSVLAPTVPLPKEINGVFVGDLSGKWVFHRNDRPARISNERRLLSGKSSKSTKASVQHDPNDLREVFMSSVQRFEVAQMELEWDTSLNTTRS